MTLKVQLDAWFQQFSQEILFLKNNKLCSIGANPGENTVRQDSGDVNNSPTRRMSLGDDRQAKFPEIS